MKKGRGKGEEKHDLFLGGTENMKRLFFFKSRFYFPPREKMKEWENIFLSLRRLRRLDREWVGKGKSLNNLSATKWEMEVCGSRNPMCGGIRDSFIRRPPEFIYLEYRAVNMWEK